MAVRESEAGANLSTVLTEVPDSYLQCRDIRHLWELTTKMHVAETTEDGDIVARHLSCARCETVRTDRYLLKADRWGVQRLAVLGATYAYPENYIIPAMSQAAHPREILRFEQMRRDLGGSVKKSRKRS